MKNSVYIFIALFFVVVKGEQRGPRFSTAGFWTLENSGRKVYNFNPAWRFYKGEAPGAFEPDYDDQDWEVVHLPHGLETLPAEASGCVNYQGVAWYRKRFKVSDSMEGKKVFILFEGIMGKCRIWMNGKFLKEHYGGYLPIMLDVGDCLDREGENIIAVMADNRDDGSYPPGKPQAMLDFAYFGGIYRDCRLMVHHPVYFTHAIDEDRVASGGFFVSYGEINEKKAEVRLKIMVRNEYEHSFSGRVAIDFFNSSGGPEKSFSREITLAKGGFHEFEETIMIENPQLWSPDSPALYNVRLSLLDSSGNIVDGLKRKIGLRSIEFKGKEGLFLNGKPIEGPLVGANRHQDFAVIGNALSNNLHWRDAKKLRDAGFKVVRNAHYPQDPAFMDACDELGLLVIVNTPGWQFWNEDPVFEKRVFSDIKNMVRRDRNRPSVFLWEPILNETWYPDSFAKKAKAAVHEEYPYPYRYCACDARAKGAAFFPVLYSHPREEAPEWPVEEVNEDKNYFTREWGDNVDDWSSHNSPSRVRRSWGEGPMLVQAFHYAAPDYDVTSYSALVRASSRHVGGCLWHSFDHQRGYHPEPFYGGVMDAFRQPKYSYYFFMSRRSPVCRPVLAETGPMVFIAHEMTPFSEEDVHVFSNCEAVRLRVFRDGEVYVKKRAQGKAGLDSYVFTFNDVYDFMKDKEKSRKGLGNDVFLLAEGLLNGKVAASHKVAPARRPEKIVLWLDDENTKLLADGSDMVVLVAAVTDKDGRIKRLNHSMIRFEIEGEGILVQDREGFSNPKRLEWGVAPILVKSSLKPGKIKVSAQVVPGGRQRPLEGVLEFHSAPPNLPLYYDDKEVLSMNRHIGKKSVNSMKMNEEKKRRNLKKGLKEVEKRQREFGE